MASVSLLDTQQSSRLIRFLSDLGVAEAKISHKNFAEQLGQLIDLSDSFTLSDSLRGLKRLPFHSKIDNHGKAAYAEAIKSDFLQQRSIIVEAIVKSFMPGQGSLALLLPDAESAENISSGKTMDAYQRFYAMQQSEMEHRIIKLRGEVRESVAGYSSELSQLSALDTVLGDTLAVASRRLFTVIPKLLRQRFNFLLQEHQKTNTDNSDDEPQLWLQTGGWLANFHNEMQGLLLAELEVRLQPVLGLIEALEERTEKTL
ncbi:MAG: DUF3348 family protein [Pseudomonadales bacterium]|nr:DUF3348 family protein [Pseudomonadales bacterium]